MCDKTCKEAVILRFPKYNIQSLDIINENIHEIM